MLKNLIFSLVILATPFLSEAENLNFCADGYFSTKNGEILFQARPWTGDYELKYNEKAILRMTGPIFNPGYRKSKEHKTEINLEKSSVVDKQKVAGSPFSSEQIFTSVNGTVLVDIKINSIDKSVKNLKYRMLFPVKHNKGKKVSWDGGKSVLPVDKDEKNIVFDDKDGVKTFRFEIKPELELGIKFLSPVKSKVLRDCRHYGNNEQNFDLSLELEGNELRYLICLLKPSEKFPSIDKKNANLAFATTKKGNLLKEGASFETGQDGVNFVNHYSWNESYTGKGIPVVLDSSTAVHGDLSAKLEVEDMNPKLGRFRSIFVEFNRIALKPNKKYTVSAWMKSDKPRMEAYIRCVGKEKRVFKLSKNWKRYNYSFTTPKAFSKLGYWYVMVGANGTRNTGTMWIDAVQLEEGDLTEFAPSSSFEFGAKIPKNHKLFPLGEKVDAVLRFRNNGDKPVNERLEYEVRDYWEQVVKKGSIEISVNPNSTIKKDLCLGGFPGGYYRAYFKVPGTEMEEAIFGVYKPLGLTKLPADWPIGGDCLDDPIVRQLGFGSVRPMGDFNFWQICPEKGKFDFSKTDIVVDRAEKNGLLLMPVLGKHFMVPSYKGSKLIPEWARKNKEPISFLHRKIFLPTIEAWKSYVKALVERYKDRVKYWEALNEPNTFLNPEAYLPYLKATWEAAKEADPDCKVVGICSTSDLGGQPAPWTCKVLELGGWKYFDILSIHMYGSPAPENTFGKGSDKMLEFLKAEMKKYGKEAPIWHSEKTYCSRTSGYSTRKLNRPYVYEASKIQPAKDFKTKSEYMVRESILSSVVGKGPFIWHAAFPNNIKISSHRYGAYVSAHHIEYDGAPTPGLLGANGLARALMGRHHPQLQLDWGGVNRCAIFSGAKGSVAAVWNWQGKSEISIPVAGKAVEILNFFGEKINSKAEKNGQIIIELETAPKYIIFPKLNADEARIILDKVSLLGGDKVKQYGCLEMNEGKPALSIYIKNKDISPLSGTVSIKSLPPNWKFVKTEQKYSDLRPGQELKLVFPIDKIQAMSEMENIEIANSIQGKSYELDLQVRPFSSINDLKKNLSPPSIAIAEKVNDASIKIDGDLSEWNETNAITLATPDKVTGKFGKWEGASDHSVSIRFRWNEKFFYAGAVIHDDQVIRNSTARTAYESDSLELFMDLDDSDREYDKTTKDTYPVNKDDFQAFLAPPSGGLSFNEASAYWSQLKGAANTMIASKRIQGGYTLEVAVPWKSFTYDFKPAIGKEIGFSFIVNDSDSKGESSESRLIWEGSCYNFKSPKDWGRLRFE